MSTTKQRRGVLAVTLAVLALFLTGCMRIHMNATINPNDTVSGGMVFAISDETAQQFGMDPQELWDQMSAEMDTSLPDGGTQSSYAQDGYTGTQMTFADVPIAQWTAGTTSEDLNISKQGDEYVIDGVMDFTDDSGDLDEVPGAENLVNSMDIQISFTFPHGITDTNGTVSGNTVTWNPSFGESVEIYARGPATGGGAAPAGPASPGTTPDGTGTTP
ncbi:MAG: hypothetical protein Q4G64_03250, partial [bacterium]|nr:hypothetical protein [bacterium]